MLMPDSFLRQGPQEVYRKRHQGKSIPTGGGKSGRTYKLTTMYSAGRLRGHGQ